MNTNKAMLLALLTITAGVNCSDDRKPEANTSASAQPTQGQIPGANTDKSKAEQLEIKWKEYGDLYNKDKRTSEEDKQLEGLYEEVHKLHAEVNGWTATTQKWLGGSGLSYAFGFKYKSKLRLLTQAVQVGAEVVTAVAATAWALGYKLIGKTADEEEELNEVL